MNLALDAVGKQIPESIASISQFVLMPGVFVSHTQEDRTLLTHHPIPLKPLTLSSKNGGTSAVSRKQNFSGSFV